MAETQARIVTESSNSVTMLLARLEAEIDHKTLIGFALTKFTVEENKETGFYDSIAVFESKAN
jgi:hypothetical protein